MRACKIFLPILGVKTADWRLDGAAGAGRRRRGRRAGSAAPMEILPAVWLTGLSSLAVVLLLDRLLRGKSRRPE